MLKHQVEARGEISVGLKADPSPWIMLQQEP